MVKGDIKTIGIFATFFAILALLFVMLKQGNGSASGLTESDVNKIVEQYLADNPQAIIDSLNNFQVQQQLAQEETTRKNLAANIERLENDPTSPVVGNPDGDVTLVEFFDYACGYCKKVFPYIYELVKEDPNLKVVFKEFPILGPNSYIATQAALAVNQTNPEKYFEVHQALMNTRLSGKDAIMKVISDAGLNAEEIEKVMQSDEVSNIINSDKEIGSLIGIRGTPAFVINGELIPGAVDYEELKRKIANARSQKTSG